PARLPEPRRELRLLRRGLRELRLEPVERDVHALEPVALGAAALRVGDHGLDAAAVLALQAVVQVEPRLDLLEAPGVRVEPLLVAPQLRAEVLRLDAKAAEPLREGVELRI